MSSGRSPVEPVETAEERELQRLAEELRQALPDPPLPRGFAERLAAARPPRWTLRAALHGNPLLRAAAALLLVFAVGVPVLTVIQLTGLLRPAAPVIHFEAPDFAPPEDPADWSPQVVAPEEPVVEELLPEELFSEELFTDEWSRAVAQENRFAAAALAFRRAFPLPAQARRALPDPAQLPANGVPAGARAGLVWRLGFAPAPEEPLLRDWNAADPADLWSELQRRLSRNEAPSAASPLTARIAALWRDAEPGSDTRGWLADWVQILEGAADVAAGGPPEPGGTAWQPLWRAARLP